MIVHEREDTYRVFLETVDWKFVVLDNLDFEKICQKDNCVGQGCIHEQFWWWFRFELALKEVFGTLIGHGTPRSVSGEALLR